MTMLEQASREWSHRPPDERYGSLAAIHAKAELVFKNAAVVKAVKVHTLQAAAKGDEIVLHGSNHEARLTHWGFSQFAHTADSPPSYLSKLPAGLAAQCINEGLARVTANNRDAEVSMLLDRSAGITVRAMNSKKYGRIWNRDITERLLDLEAAGTWQPAPAAFDGSRGLYMGDQDLFAFMVDNERRIFETLPGGGLSRGFFARNSEVGAGSFDLYSFFYEFICGNHRVWGVKEVKSIKVRHIGEHANARADAEWKIALKRYAEASASEDEAKIQAARDFVVGATKEEILDVLFKQVGGTGMTQKLTKDSMSMAEVREDRYGNPFSAWGIAGGMTEIARDLPNADDRVMTEKAATRVMEMAW